jgi:hypothetical protein
MYGFSLIASMLGSQECAAALKAAVQVCENKRHVASQ